MRIGILGGSFDPIHHGHLITAEVLREALRLEEVLVTPAGTQPFKVGRHWAGAEDRAAMVALAIATAPGLRLDRREVDRTGPSYTVDSLRALAGERPGAQLVLLVGSDAAAEFSAWRESEAIRQLAEVVAFPRPGGPPAESLGFASVAVPQLDLSATTVRERVAQGLSIRFMVPDPVAEYIATHRLYRGVEG